MTEQRALIVDDEPDIRELLEITLGRMGIATASAANLAEARQLLAEQPFDVCLTDMNLPDGNGIELVRHISSQHANLPVAMITAHGSMDAAIEALKAGAFDFVSKPVDLPQLRTLIDQALKLESLSPTPETDDEIQLLGQSESMSRLRKQVTRLARSQAPIYISGESGSGKEIVARNIHALGPRAAGPFVPVNCGAIPGELMESEFFGHLKGSFTGAVNDKTGLFQAANGGTLFLDEVAELPVAMQVKLLRAIQEKAVRAVGSPTEQSIDVRLLSATHRNLADLVETGDFRQDLYYRINVIQLHVPALRERVEDVPMFVEMILEKNARAWGEQAPSLDAGAMRALTEYSFPGNVRELENILERAATLCDDNVIRADDLHFAPASGVTNSAGAPHPPVHEVATDPSEPEEPGESDDDGTLEGYLETLERQKIMEALEESRWNKTAAAKRLGITFRALRYRLKKLGLE